MRWCITEGKTTNLYNCGFPSNHVVPYFATTMSSLWNMLLNRNGREIWWRTWSRYCLKLKELPEGLENMGSLLELFLDGTAIKEIPSSIQHLSGLVLLNLRECKSLAILPHSICKLKSLHSLILYGFGSLQGLEKLEAAGTAIKELPPFISLLENLELLPKEIPRSGVLQLPSFFGLRSLRKLNQSDCNILEGAIPNLSRNNLITLPASLNQLSQLKGLRLELPSSIEEIDAHDCTVLENILCPSSVYRSKECGGLQFAFSNCFRLSKNESSNFVAATLREMQSLANKLPRFQFPIQSIGSTVMVHMPPNQCNARLMGLNSSDEGHRFIKSDHMWLGYQPISRIGIGHSNGLNMLSQIQASFQCGVHLLYEQDENEDNQPEFQCSTTDENSSFFTIKDYGELTHLLFTMLI
ncbi:hypothetical protein AAG906_018848 [Vitis piasezkii]